MNLKQTGRFWFGGAVIGFAVLALTGCKGIATHGEREARQQIGTVKAAYRPNDRRPALPDLTTNSSLGDFLTYAMLNQPQIEAAYYDWAASVENITVARSLPDPQLTFQADIVDVVSSVMPGLMQQFPGPGKLRAQARAAAADSRGKYFAFESAALRPPTPSNRAIIGFGSSKKKSALTGKCSDCWPNWNALRGRKTKPARRHCRTCTAPKSRRTG